MFSKSTRLEGTEPRSCQLSQSVWKGCAPASCWAPLRYINSRAVGPRGLGSQEEGTAEADLAPCSRHVLLSRHRWPHVPCHASHPVRLPSPCRVRNGLQLTICLTRGSQIEVGVVGMAPHWGSAYAFTGSLGMCGLNEAVLCQQLGYWVLHARAGQRVLNVTGRMKGQLTTGERGGGWGPPPCHGLIWPGGWVGSAPGKSLAYEVP